MLTKMVQTETIGFGKGHFCLDMNPVFFFFIIIIFFYIYIMNMFTGLTVDRCVTETKIKTDDGHGSR